MKKNKILAAVISVVMVLSITTITVNAETINIDELYKNAYNATEQALKLKNQDSVNLARKEIKKLPVNLNWAIGEFSKKLDTIQHPILVNIITSIKIAEKTMSQESINIAKASIPAELTPVFKNSYSSAVDVIQQKIQANAVNLLKKAEREKTKYSVDKAFNAINDIKKATSPAIVNWTKDLETRVKAIKISNGIKEGTYKVGVDIASGEYIVISEGMAYLEVSYDSTGKSESIIFNENITPNSNSYITLKSGEYFKFTNGEIYPISEGPSIIPPDGLYKDGMYKVGQDIPAGEYKITLNSTMGYYEILKNSSHDVDSIIEENILQSDTYLTLKEGQYIKIIGLKIQK